MKEKSQGNSRPAVEWGVAALSGALVFFLIAFLGHQALFNATRDADLVVSIDRIEQSDSGTIVMFFVANRGDKAAGAVTVNASLVKATAPVKQIQFDYIAAHAIRRGVFQFSRPVEPSMLDIQIGGYSEL